MENSQKVSLDSVNDRRLLLNKRLGPVVQKPISASPGVKFNPGFSLLCLKALFSDNFLCYF